MPPPSSILPRCAPTPKWLGRVPYLRLPFGGKIEAPLEKHLTFTQTITLD